MRHKFVIRWQPNQIKKVLNVLPTLDRRKIFYVIILQVLMGFFDLVGVALLGILGTLTVSGVQSNQPGSRIQSFLRVVHLDSFYFQNQAAILGGAACLVLVSRTIFSVVFNRRILFYLSRRGAVLSTEIASKVLSLPLISMQVRNTQNYVFAITNGVNAVTLGIIGSFVILIADFSLLIVMSIGLFLVSPLIALASLLIFGFVGVLVFKLIHVRVKELGKYESSLTIETNSKIIEVLETYRESVVRNRREYYAREIGKLRWSMADTVAELTFMPNISKYVIESTLVISALIISAIAFSRQDAASSFASLAIFMAAGTRIAPAILRIQQGALQIKSSLGTATPTLELLEDLREVKTLNPGTDEIETSHAGFSSGVVLESISLVYPGKTQKSLSEINLSIAPGESVAIVGPSGAGKTSLVDVILGVVEASEGIAKISGMSPHHAIFKWPGAIGYVPQDVVIVDGTIKENVCLGFPEISVPDELVIQALQDAQLMGLVDTLADGINSYVGERGSRISGGQRQRLGIARAFLTRPKLLILDEATSALDAETESDISSVLLNLQGKVTVVMIAHRLSTVRRSDKVIYLDNGQIIAQGSFEAIRNSVPNFDKQAKLLEL
jgi:ABC-type multidrug transport system fused ATPase/permease subunit